MAFPKISQILRFLSAGAIGTLLYYTTLYCLTEFVGVWYIASAIVAFLLNITSNFILQKFWTFKNQNVQVVHRQAGQYALLAMCLFFLNLGVLYVCVEYLHLWYLFAQVLSTALLTLISFVVSRRIFGTESKAGTRR